MTGTSSADINALPAAANMAPSSVDHSTKPTQKLNLEDPQLPKEQSQFNETKALALQLVKKRPLLSAGIIVVTLAIILLTLYLLFSTLSMLIFGSVDTVNSMAPGGTVVRINKETGEKETITKSQDGKTIRVKTDHGSTETTQEEDGTQITKTTEVEDGGVRTRVVVRLPDPTASPAFRGKTSAMHGLPDSHQNMLQNIVKRMNGDEDVADHEADEHHDGHGDLGSQLLQALMQAQDPFSAMGGTAGMMMMQGDDENGPGGMIMMPSPMGGGGIMMPMGNGGVHVVHLGRPGSPGGGNGIEGLMNALMPTLSLEDMIRHAIIEDIMNDINTKYKDVPDKFKDPVTHALLDEPVHIHWPGDEIFTEVAFEKHQVMHWFKIGHRTNPYNDEEGVTNTDVIDLPDLKEEIKKWKNDHPDMIHLDKDEEGETKPKLEKRVLVLGSEDNDEKKRALQKEFESKGFDSIDIRNYETVHDFIDETQFNEQKYHAIYDIGLLPKAYKDLTQSSVIATFWGKVETLFATEDSEFITTNKLDPETVKEGHEAACKAQKLSCHSLKIQALKTLGGGAHWTRWRREL